MFQTFEMASEDVKIRLHHEHNLLDHALSSRLEGEYCDVILISEDRRTVMVHSWVMARSSSLLSSLLREMPRCQCKDMIRVTVAGVSGDILSNIVSLIYSGEATLNQTHVHDIFDAAKLLGIQNILQPKLERQAKEKLLNDEAVDDPELEQLFDMTNDSDNSSDAESGKEEDDEKIDFKIERLMNLVTTEDVTNDDELDQLVTELFKEEEKDPVEEEKKKYTVTGEKRNPGRGHGQKLSTVCPKCDKRFEARHGMMYHYRRMHTKEGRQRHLEVVNRPRLCLECGKDFKTLSSYNYHMRYKHKPVERKYACDQCEYRTTTTTLLSKHKLHNHTEKSFICDQCSKAFALNSQLDQHIKVVHQGIMIHCPECDFKSTTKQGLKKHYDMIHLKKKFPCSICSKEYSTQFNLNTHTKRDHGFVRKVFKKLKLENGKTCMYKPTDGGTD